MKNSEIVRRINQKRAFLAVLDRFVGLAIGLGIIAAYGLIHTMAGS